MRFAICNETFQDWPLDRALAFARECGYTGVEIAPFTLDKDARRITSAQRAEVREAARRHGLEVVGLHWLLAHTEGFHLTTADAAVRRATREYLEELTRLCADLGGSLMVLGSPKQRNLEPGVTHAQGMLHAAEVLRELAPTLERHRVTLAVEPLGPAEGDFLLTADAGAELVAMVDSPWCRLHLDVKAMSSEGPPIADIIRRHAHHMAHFHANDANRLGPGMGEIDFAPILRELLDCRYTGWVSVEVFDYSPGIERLCRESIGNLRRSLAAAS